MTILVCGTRTFLPKYRKDQIFETLTAMHQRDEITRVVCGGAGGVDCAAVEWAKLFEIDYAVYPAKWRTYGNPSGPIRNERMVAKEPGIRLVVAFPGNEGTDNMKEVAAKYGIEVIEIQWVK